MNCSNQKCKKEIRNYYTCKKCGLNFCTNSCMTDHTFEAHSSNINSNNSIQKNPSRNSRISAKKSLFIKFGEFAKEIFDDPYYNFINFEFVKEKKKSLGSGAFGEVFLAKNKIDGKNFAIKIMEKDKITESGASLDIIYREISIHRRISHDNIVKLYSHHEEKNNFYLIMEYINGGSLFSYIKKNRGVDEKNAFKFFIQACTAVNFLHENNLIHRDLKPENLLIDDKENLKLCDFGWCVDITSGSRVTFCGTYEYMAPEIVKEAPYDLGIDVWSLGILLYELIHGYSPFRAQKDNHDDYNEIFKNIIKYKFKIEKDLSKGCVDLITKLLTPENKSRIKVKEIFAHPWVLEFEKQYKEEKIKESINNSTINVNSINVSKNINNLADSIINEVSDANFKLDKKNLNSNELNISTLNDKKPKEKLLSEKIQEKLNNLTNKVIKNKEIKNNIFNNKIEEIDLNEIENKLNRSLMKNKENSIIDKSANLEGVRKLSINQIENSKNLNHSQLKNSNKIQELSNWNIDSSKILDMNNQDQNMVKNRKNSKKSENPNLNNISILSINNDIMNLNDNNLNENLNNISYNDLNNLNSQLIKRISNNNFNMNQFNFEDVNNANDNFLQNNISINRNFVDLKNDYFNLLDKEGNLDEEENFEYDNNIHIGNVDEIQDGNEEIKADNKFQQKNDIGKNFDNAENKFFDFVLNQVQKKNIDKKSKKTKSKKIDKMLNDISENLINSKVYYKDDDNSISYMDNSLNINFGNMNENQTKNTKKTESFFVGETKNLNKNSNLYNKNKIDNYDGKKASYFIEEKKNFKKLFVLNENSIFNKETKNIKEKRFKERKTENFNLFDESSGNEMENKKRSYVGIFEEENNVKLYDEKSINYIKDGDIFDMVAAKNGKKTQEEIPEILEKEITLEEAKERRKKKAKILIEKGKDRGIPTPTPTPTPNDNLYEEEILDFKREGNKIKIKKQLLIKKKPKGSQKEIIAIKSFNNINKELDLRDHLEQNNNFYAKYHENINIIRKNSMPKEISKTNLHIDKRKDFILQEDKKQKKKTKLNQIISKDLDKQLNLEFMPKDIMYNDFTYNESAKHMLDSINILEKAKTTKIRNEAYKKENSEDVWSKIGDFFNPFKCGKY